MNTTNIQCFSCYAGLSRQYQTPAYPGLYGAPYNYPGPGGGGMAGMFPSYPGSGPAPSLNMNTMHVSLSAPALTIHYCSPQDVFSQPADLPRLSWEDSWIFVDILKSSSFYGKSSQLDSSVGYVETLVS